MCAKTPYFSVGQEEAWTHLVRFWARAENKNTARVAAQTGRRRPCRGGHPAVRTCLRVPPGPRDGVRKGFRWSRIAGSKPIWPVPPIHMGRM